MAGRRAGLRMLIMDVSPAAIWAHCMVHRKQLAAKELSVALADILQQIITMVNYIKPQPLRARLFATLRCDLGSEHDNLLFHTEVRWLGLDNALL